MPTQTARFNLNKYSQGEDNWSHSDTVDLLDQLAIEKDLKQNRPTSGDYDNELFYAVDENILYRWVSSENNWIVSGGNFNDSLLQDGKTKIVPDGKNQTHSGTYNINGTLTSNGSLTASGPIVGYGSIDGSGNIASSGVIADSIEPINPTELNSKSVFLAISGWTTDNNSNIYDFYRFERNSSIEISKDGYLTFRRQ